MENQTNKPVKSYAARRRTRKAIALAGLALFMALTIGLTWTFWSTGILTPQSDDRNDGIWIGQGMTINTIMRLGEELEFEGTEDDGDRLIPQDIFENYIAEFETDGAAEYAIAVIPVRWDTALNEEDVRQALTDGFAPARLWVDVSETLTGTTLANTAGSGYRYRDLYIAQTPNNTPLAAAQTTPAVRPEGATRYHNWDGGYWGEGGLETDVRLFEISFFFGDDMPTAMTEEAVLDEFAEFTPGELANGTTASNAVGHIDNVDVGADIMPVLGAELNTVYIAIVIRMNFPLSQTAYDAITDREVGFEFSFGIVHELATGVSTAPNQVIP